MHGRRKLVPGALIALAAMLALLAGCEADDEVVAEDDEPEADEPDEDAPDDEPTDEPDDDPDDDTDDEPTDDEPIRIGGTLGLTGAFAQPSSQFQVAYEYWEDRVNEDGGILGRPVEMVIYDDESEVETAQDLYQRLMFEDEVDLLLGPFATGPGGAVITAVAGNDRVLWNDGFIGLELYIEHEDNMINFLTYNELDYIQPLFDMLESLPEDERPERLGLATVQEPFQLMVRDGLEGEGGGVIEMAEELGIELVMDEEYPSGPADVGPMISEAQSADVEVFLNIGFPDDGTLFASTAHEEGFEPDVFCVCGSQVTVLPVWDDLGEAGEHVMGPTTGWPESDDFAELDELYDVVQEELGTESIASTSIQGLTVLQVLEQAIEETGTVDEWELYDHVLDNTFETASGTLEFPDRTWPEDMSMLLQWQDGRNEAVWPEERATTEPIIPMDR
ncbi:hypothetical protein ER308_15655 [Egibacter rhizosphaerae]|uniref:Leucine-binding protein domain-containing protein n=1 Tax=Egibacter rhizosphaerae TaxID=1670831 RepID=A0A411YHQ6_9ACTN|nr:amino acid ABC transporter substrate-binding protein [Egibacter rhizosphaerae]QBI20865.1 hypothetical protein ER308_15655 [Egibacter rhizosphaerae]